MDDVRRRPRRRWSGFRDAAVVLAEYAAESVYGLLHPDWRRSGAPANEAREGLPGDDLVREPNWSATRALTVEATPERVWPWLVQMGYGRGGWYGDLPWWKDPAGHAGPASSAWELLPDTPPIAVGDVLLDGPNCDETKGGWRVAEVEAGHHLVLFSARTIYGRELTDDRPYPPSWFACSWSFVLHPMGDRTCRLVVRTRVHYRPAWMVGAAGVLRSGDTVMQRAMLMGIKRRVEASMLSGAVVEPWRRPTDPDREKQ